MGVGRGALGSEDQSDPTVQHRSVARASTGNGSRSSTKRVVRSRALGLLDLARLTDDPTTRDLSIKCSRERLVRVGRSAEAKALAENFMNSEAAKNDVLLELALRQSYWNTAESQESSPTGFACLAVATPLTNKFVLLFSNWHKQWPRPTMVWMSVQWSIT